MAVAAVVGAVVVAGVVAGVAGNVKDLGNGTMVADSTVMAGDSVSGLRLGLSGGSLVS
jgi:hypothetical protein